MAADSEYRVLILEDRPEDCELVDRVLRKEGLTFVMHRVETEPDMLRELKEFNPDIIISDYVMPEFNALRALSVALKAAPDVPFIVVSGTVGEETAADTIRSGASDYVMKDNLKRLGPAIKRELNKAARRRKMKQTEAELRTRLRNAEQMETLGKMAGKIAHDLNNILGPVVAYPDLILEQLPEDSPVCGDILEIKKSAEHAADMIKDLLTLSRRGNYQANVVDINQVVNNYMNSLGYTTLKNRFPNQNVECRLADNLPMILGSSAHLQAVLMNLIINAFDASSGSPVYISTYGETLEKKIRGHEIIPPDEYVILSVADEGHGITPDDMTRLFEPFFTRKAMGKSGTGLGLAIVFGIVKDHQGFIDIESRPEEGTKFKLYFPSAGDMDVEEDEKVMDFEGDETILVVDDLKPQRDLAEALLTSMGYRVLTASNEYEVMDILDENKVNLVMLDMNMGESHDGLNIYKHIIENKPDQSCMIVSGSAADELVKKIQELGCGAFVQKPFTRPILGKAVRQELDNNA